MAHLVEGLDGQTLTNQLVFNYVWQKFVVEDCGKDSKAIASYSHKPNGCFIGCLFTSEFALELDRVCDIANVYVIERIFQKHESSWLLGQFYQAFEKCDLDFLSELQSIHDQTLKKSFTANVIKPKLSYLAEKFDLTIPE